MQHAIRLLVILAECGDDCRDADPADAVKVIRSELKLQALDFWLRNPDYLADELLTKVETDELGETYVTVAYSLLNDPEPDLRWYPMPRWRFGAYEAIDDAMSLLQTYGLAYPHSLGTPKNTNRRQLFLTTAGREAAQNLANEPRLSWYTEQVTLVKLAAGEDNGSQLKQRQYRQAEYANTELGTHIASIAGRVRDRLAARTATPTGGQHP
jgi:hypothetical protein